MNQAELQSLTTERLLDAAALMAGGRWSFAYYVAGYAVECALKSCVLARMIHTGLVFQEKFKATECLTHDFEELVRLAGLGPELIARQAASRAAGDDFSRNWGTALKWQVATRYAPTDQAAAEELFRAITDDPNGVLKWVQSHW